MLGLLAAERRVHVVRDAVDSRTAANQDAALHCMKRHGVALIK